MKQMVDFFPMVKFISLRKTRFDSYPKQDHRKEATSIEKHLKISTKPEAKIRCIFIISFLKVYMGVVLLD